MNQIASVLPFVDRAKHQFMELARLHNAVDWAAECYFAKEALTRNAFLCRTAAGNPDSLQRAIVGVASIGLSLNPHKQLAYLVPRQGAVCLDIGWRGYIQQALDINSITAAMVELRYKNDKFEFQGAFKSPIHQFDPDDDRGPLRGGYCVAKLANGDELVTYMTIEEVFKIRDRTESWKAFIAKGSMSPWKTDTNEMVKKTIIRRAWKMWPKKDLSRAAALESFEDSGDRVALAPAPAPEDDAEAKQFLLNIRTALDVLEKSESAYVLYLQRINNRSEDLKTLEDLTKDEMRKALAVLNQLVDEKTARDHAAAEKGNK